MALEEFFIEGNENLEEGDGNPKHDPLSRMLVLLLKSSIVCTVLVVVSISFISFFPLLGIVLAATSLVVILNIVILFHLPTSWETTRGYSEKDLRYIGFSNTGNRDGGNAFYYIAGIGYTTDMDENWRVKPEPSNRLKAFFQYGFSSLFIKLKGKQTFGYSSGDINFVVKNSEGWPARRLIETLMFNTIKASNRVTKRRKFDSTLNPIPYAAYLFRVASLNGNPKSREVQKKALLLWEGRRSLKVAVRLASHSLEDLTSYSGLPDSWVEDIALVTDEMKHDN